MILAEFLKISQYHDYYVVELGFWQWFFYLQSCSFHPMTVLNLKPKLQLSNSYKHDGMSVQV